jgi:uncharacterized protein
MSEQHTPSNGSRFHAGMLLPRGNNAVATSLFEELPSATRETDSAEGMQVYSPKNRVDLESLMWLGPPGPMGGEVLSGEPRLYGRFDFREGNVAAGVFMATTGLIRVTFPFTEHATILEGEVTITDEAGQTRSLKAGDSYFIRQNQVILWDVKGQHVLKSFFNITEQ